MSSSKSFNNITKPNLAVSTDPWDFLSASSPSGSLPSATSCDSVAPSLQATSSSSSGEFNAFSFVGAAVAAGTSGNGGVGGN